MDGIRHTGTVTDAGNGWVAVRLDVAASDCGGCALSASCSRKSVVRVGYAGDSGALLGKTVTVESDAGSARTALAMFIALPLAACLIGGGAACAFSLSEGAVAAAGLGSMAMCYFAEWLLRRKWARRYEFRLAQMEKEKE